MAIRQPRASISPTGASPELTMKFELVLMTIVAPRAAINSISSGRK